MPGQSIGLALSEGRVTLYPQWTEAIYYEPFGTPIAATDVDARYTDHEYDQASAFHYMKGRFQDPGIAKFTRPDPMRDWDWLAPFTINLYEYVVNDAVNSFDPSGFGTIFVGGAGNRKDTESYANQIVSKMNAAGISDSKHVYPSNEVGESKTRRINWTLAFSEKAGRYVIGGGVGVPFHQVLDPGPVIEPVVDAYDRGSGQFNLVGYSFGSVVAAQAAFALAKDGKQVDNVVLIGAPLAPDGELIKTLAAQDNIKQVTFININDDPFSSGIDLGTAFDKGFNAHFYFISNDVGQQDQLVRVLTEIFGAEQAEKVIQRYILRETTQDKERVEQSNQDK